MVYRVQAGLVMTLLVAVTLAGCLGGDASPDEQEMRDPEWRIRDVTQRSSVDHDYCPHVPPGPDQWDCFDYSIRFQDLRCDPTQNVLVDRDLSHPEKGAGWEGPGDRYLFCEYSMAWELTAYSMVPDTQVHARMSLDDQKMVQRCSTGREGSCTVDGRIEGAFEMRGDWEQEQLTAELTGGFAGLSDYGILPVHPHHGRLQASEDLRIFT